MNIGEQRRTVYVEPIEEPPDDPALEPRREAQPPPTQPVHISEPSKRG